MHIRELRLRPIVPLALTTALVVATLSANPALAQTRTSTFTASVQPTQITVGQASVFTLTLTVAANSSNSLGSAQVVVPSGFTGVTPGSTTVPTGWVYSLPSCSADSPAGCGAPGSTLVQVSTPSSNGAQKVGPGQSLTFTISATPSSKGAKTWSVGAKNSAAWSTGQQLTLQGPAPVVTVYGAPAKLAFGTAPPTTTVAGQPFGATVQILDADGAPTLSTATVTLSGTSLTGTTSVAAVSGTAGFSGLTLTKAGTDTVTASSGSLTSASADVVVTPAAPAKLVVSGPTDPVSAGSAFAVGVTVTDTYDNPVDPQVQVNLSVDGVATASQTTVGGSTAFLAVAPTVPGSHTYTVASSGLSSTFGFTVVAAPPVVLTIASVTDEASVGVLTTNAPFDVVVTARDSYGNPSPYSGTVTLATSGGVGRSLGTLAGNTTATFVGTAAATVTGATYTGYGNAITLTASAPGLTSGNTSIDVALFATVQNSAPGQNTTVGNGGCTDASPSVPVCSTLFLPNGANGKVTLSQGFCNPYTTCLSGPQSQALLVNGTANLTDPTTGRPLYTRSNPATVQLRCDKTLCGGAGTNTFPILFQPTGGGSFVTAPPCPSKGHIGAGQTFCQDFVQDHRDNSGDLIAYLLFLDDLKTTFG